MRLASVLGLVLFLGGCPIEVDLPDGSLPSELTRDGGAPSDDADEAPRDPGGAAGRPAMGAGYDGGFAELPSGMMGERGGPGRIDLYLTDAPAEFDAVWVTIGRVEAAVAVDGQERWVPLGGMPQRFDLLTLRNDESVPLGSAWVPPMAYSRLRIHVVQAALVVHGEERPLPIPAGLEDAIVIDFGLKVESNVTYAVVLDFDAAASIHFEADHFVMHPVIHVKHIARMNHGSWSDQPPPDGGTPNVEDAGVPGGGEPDGGPHDAGDDDQPIDAGVPADAGDSN